MSTISPRRATALMTSALATTLVVATLTACAAPEQTTGPQATSTTAPTPSVSTAPTASPTPTRATPTELSDLDIITIEQAVSVGDVTLLEPYLSDPTHVAIAASDYIEQLAPLDAVFALDYVRPGSGTWQWDIPVDEVATFRASEYYGDYFPEDVIVGRSSEGPVIAFSPAASGAEIDAILMAIDTSILTN